MTRAADFVIRNSMDSSCENGCSIAGSRCKLPLLLGLVLLAILVLRGFGPRVREIEKPPDVRSSTSPAPAGSANEIVSMTVEFGDGRRQEFAAIPWRSGMTVADLFLEVSGIVVIQEGTGEAAFLTGMNGIENMGAEGRNWIYEVNGQSGDRSFAVYEIHPGDRVLWTFRASR